MRWTWCFVCSLFSRHRQRERCPTSLLPGTTQPTPPCHHGLAVRSLSVQLACVPYVNRLWATDLLQRPSSVVPLISRTPSPKWAQRAVLLGQFTHLRSVPRHALYQAPLRCEQRVGCRPKVTSFGDSSLLLIATISSIASISLLLHDMEGL